MYIFYGTTPHISALGDAKRDQYPVLNCPVCNLTALLHRQRTDDGVQSLRKNDIYTGALKVVRLDSSKISQPVPMSFVRPQSSCAALTFFGLHRMTDSKPYSLARPASLVLDRNSSFDLEERF